MISPLLLIEKPLQDSIASSYTVTTLMVAFFILSSLAVAFGKRTLVQLVCNIFVTKERNSLFDASTNVDWWVSLILILQACAMFSLNMLVYFDADASNELFLLKLFGACFLFAFVYLVFKFIAYALNGWLFFDSGNNGVWIDTYKTIIYCNSFLFFLLALLTIYFNLSFGVLQIVIITIFAADKILALYKWTRLFLTSKVGFLLFFLQFCALEILPVFLGYRILLEINTLLK